MTLILILVAFSALAGVVAARIRFSWLALIVADLVIAPIAAVVLQQESFAALPGILAMFGCLMACQIAYGMAMANDPRTTSADNAQRLHGSTISAAEDSVPK
jgi:hypothetical protein